MNTYLLPHLVLTVSASLVAAVFVSTSPSARASVIAYDGFEGYAAGSNLNGGSLGTGWAGNWGSLGGHTTVQATTLIDPGGNVGTGLQAARLQPTTGLGDVGNFMNRAFPAATGPVYVGFLIRNAGGVDNADFYNFQVSDGATGNVNAALGVGIRNNPGNPFFARVGSSGGGTTTNSSTNATAGDDFLVVAKFSMDGSSNYNRTDLFINPSGFVEPVTADATAISGVTGLSSLSLFSVRNFNPEALDTVFIDELRIATTFASALGVPEPSRALMLLLGISGLVLRRRRGPASG